MACATRKLEKIKLTWKKETAVCLVLASQGYPGSYPKGLEITGLDRVNQEIVIFHAGTSSKDGKLYTNGGRVLNVCALAENLESARKMVYEAAKQIEFEGKYYRHDIGLI